MLTRETVESIVACRLSDAQIVAHLEQLASTELDVDTLGTFIDVLFATLDEPSRRLSADVLGALDCSGTGGSGLPHFNTSTTVAFVLAAGGIKVAKFGNRSAQSHCGSFDLLETLGIPAAVPPEAVPELLSKTGLAFLFAPQYYPGLARLAPIRKAIGKRTIFNSIGPLLNPVRPFYRVMGVSCPSAQRLVAEYLSCEKTNRRSLIVRSQRGLDELEPGRLNVVIDAMQGYVTTHAIKFASNCDLSTIGAASKLPSAEENHQVLLDTIGGEGPPEIMEIVCLNAAAGLVASGWADLESSVEVARELLLSGQVAEKVEQCRRAYARFAPR